MARMNVLQKCTCTSSKDNISEYPEIKVILPIGYEYTMCEWFWFNAKEKHFECRFRVNVSTKNEALSWIDAFKASSCSYFNVAQTYPENTLNNIAYKVILKCYRNTRPKSQVKQPHPLHTNCQARLTITVKQIKLPNNNQITDVHLEAFPMIVVYRNKHNHMINPINALQKYSANSDITDLFIKYFEKGLTPIQAIEQYTLHLKERYGSEFHKALKDESVFPTKRTVYYLYKKAFSKKYKQSRRKEMLQSLKSHITKYNFEMKGRFSELKFFDNGNFITVVVSPLMKRVLEHFSKTSNVLFVDSIDNADGFESKLFVLLIKSYCGALPVGCIITSSESEDILKQALRLFKTFLSSSCFGGKGLVGPKIIMLEDSATIKKSFAKVFPNSTLLLNTLLLLRESWKHLLTINVPLKRQMELFLKMKEMFNCTSEEQLCLTYYELKNNSLADEFLKYASYIDKLYAKKEEWAKCFHYALRRKHDDITSELVMNILKDNIFQIKKSYSAVQLFNYIVSDIEQFYRNKLISVLDDPLFNRINKTDVHENEFEKLSLLKYNDDLFKVRSKIGKRSNFVDLDVGVCTCRHGKYGAICDHQLFVLNKKYHESRTSLSLNMEQKAILLYTVTGKTDILNYYLNSICDTSSEESLEGTSEVLNLELGSEEQSFNSEFSDENLDSKLEEKIKIIENFRECAEMIVSKADNNIEILLAAKQLVNNFKKLKTDNSLIFALKCFGKFDESNLTNLTDSKISNADQSAVCSNKRSLTEICEYNEKSKLELKKKSRTTTPHTVYIIPHN